MNRKESGLYNFMVELDKRLQSQKPQLWFDNLKENSRSSLKGKYAQQHEQFTEMAANPKNKTKMGDIVRRNELISNISDLLDLKQKDKLGSLDKDNLKFVNDFLSNKSNMKDIREIHKEYAKDSLKLLDPVSWKALEKKEKEEALKIKNTPAPQVQVSGTGKTDIDLSGCIPDRITQGDVKIFGYDVEKSVRHTEEFSGRITSRFDGGKNFTTQDIEYGVKMFDKNFSSSLLTMDEQRRAFDNIFIDGVSINKLCFDKQNPLTVPEKKCLVAAYAMQRGTTVVDIVQTPERNGTSKIVSLVPQMDEMTYNGPKTTKEVNGARAKAFFQLKWGSIGKINDDFTGYNSQKSSVEHYKESLYDFTKDSSETKFKARRHESIKKELSDRDVEMDYEEYHDNLAKLKAQAKANDNQIRREVNSLDRDGLEVVRPAPSPAPVTAPKAPANPAPAPVANKK